MSMSVSTPVMTGLEQDVLQEYAKLLTNMNTVILLGRV
jgi:hypothetical protein